MGAERLPPAPAAQSPLGTTAAVQEQLRTAEDPPPAQSKPLASNATPARLAVAGQRAIWRHVSHPQLSVVPRHVGMRPLHPRQPAQTEHTHVSKQQRAEEAGWLLGKGAAWACGLAAGGTSASIVPRRKSSAEQPQGQAWSGQLAGRAAGRGGGAAVGGGGAAEGGREHQAEARERQAEAREQQA